MINDQLPMINWELPLAPPKEGDEFFNVWGTRGDLKIFTKGAGMGMIAVREYNIRR